MVEREKAYPRFEIFFLQFEKFWKIKNISFSMHTVTFQIFWDLQIINKIMCLPCLFEFYEILLRKNQTHSIIFSRLRVCQKFDFLLKVSWFLCSSKNFRQWKMAACDFFNSIFLMLFFFSIKLAENKELAKTFLPGYSRTLRKFKFNISSIFSRLSKIQIALKSKIVEAIGIIVEVGEIARWKIIDVCRTNEVGGIFA